MEEDAVVEDVGEEEEEEEEEEEVREWDEQVRMNGGAVEEELLSPAMSLPFPVSRLRRLIKSENEIAMVGMEAIVVIAKAAELFLEQFVEDAFKGMAGEDRSTLVYKDLSSTVSSMEKLEFLADFVPDKVPASRALAEAPFQIS